MTQKHEAPNAIQVQKFLGGLDYPVGKEDLLERAKQEGADDNILKILEKIPEREYASPIAVSREVSKIH